MCVHTQSKLVLLGNLSGSSQNEREDRQREEGGSEQREGSARRAAEGVERQRENGTSKVASASSSNRKRERGECRLRCT